MLVNILGADGCGKTTQISKLIAWTRDFGLSARSLAKRDIFDLNRYPECAFFGCEYETLAHELLPRMRGESRALWLIYMNAVLIRGNPPSEREVVFLDGYWHKHYATEAAFGISERWLLDVCAFFPEPDITVVLDLDPQTIVQRGHLHHPYESGCDFGCSDLAFVQHQGKVRGVIRRLADAKGYAVFDADRPVDELFAALTGYLEAPIREYAGKFGSKANRSRGMSQQVCARKRSS